MNVFLFDEFTGGALHTICEKTGAKIFGTEIMRTKDESSNAMNFFLDTADVLVIEITHTSQMMHFILAQAILANKPTLCLYKKNNPPRDVLYYIRKRKTPRPIKTFSYTDDDIERTVMRFIQVHDAAHQVYDTKPSIKYTLRLTPHIDRYLHWLSKQQGKTKADLIRLMLEDVAMKDYDYTDPEGDR